MATRVAGALPPEWVRRVQVASVAPHVRTLFAHLPHDLTLDAALPDPLEGVPPTAFQLLKLALGVGRIRVERLELGAPLRLCFASAGRTCVLGEPELQAELRAVARDLVTALLDGGEAAQLLESFAVRTSSLTMLQRITNRMLQATELDQALYVMLSGLTSGHGLSFHRAALFIRDPESGVFTGSKAVGPADAAEAHRIWEQIELEDKSIDQLIDDCAKARDTRFQQQVQALRLEPGPGDDEVARALAYRVPFRSQRPPRNPALASLNPAPEFVLAAIRSHDEVFGLVFADNPFGSGALTLEQRTHISFFIDQTALVWQNVSLLRRVEQLAQRDGLTGLFNRREFEARFERERSRSKRYGSSCALMVIDLDGFKAINDTFGHASGDVVLRKVAMVLQANLREHDTVARFGGDEFVVLLPDATPAQLIRSAQRMGLLAREQGISISIGGASWPSDCAQLDALLGAADAELYRAKRAGRGCAFVAGKRIEF